MAEKYTVPQFIDVEDKILGPITTRQFVILLVTALLLFILYKIFTFVFFLVIGVPLFAFGGTVAFMRINGQPFHYFMLNLLQTFRSPRLRVWDKELEDGDLRALMAVTIAPPPPPKIRKEPLTTSKLSELSLVVNTGGVYRSEDYD